MARTNSRHKDVLLGVSFFALALVMLAVAATEARAAGAVGGCPGAPHELLIKDAELCREASAPTGSAGSSQQPTPSDSSLGWFLAAVVTGLAVLAAFAIEAPSSRPFVPPTTQAMRL